MRESAAAVGGGGMRGVGGNKLRNNMDVAEYRRSERGGSRVSMHGTLIHGVRPGLTDGVPFEEMVPRRTVELDAPLAESARMESAMRTNLNDLNSTP